SVRIDETVGRTPRSADDAGHVDLRRKGRDFLHRHHAARDTVRILESDVSPELLEVILLVEHEEVAAPPHSDLLLHLVGKPLHHPEAQLRQLDVHAARELVTHPTGVEPGGSQPEHLARFENDHVGATALGKVVGCGGPHDAAAYDDCVCYGLH